jgi:hypothetical protein
MLNLKIFIKFFIQFLIKEKKIIKSRTMSNISDNILTDFSSPSLINVSFQNEILILRKEVDEIKTKLRFIEGFFKVRNILNNGFVLFVRLAFFFYLQNI